MKSLFSRTFYCLPIVSILLTMGCGGSSGGSGNSQSPTGQEAIVRPSYSGTSEQASLTRQNAIPYFWIGYELIEASVAMASLFEHVGAPRFLLVTKSLDQSSETCDEENLIIDDRRADNQYAGIIHFNFSNCIIADFRYDGRVTVSIIDDPVLGYPHSVDVNGLRVISENDETILAGIITYDRQDGMQSDEVILRSSALNKTFKLTDFSYRNFTLSTKLYDSETGWVSLSQPTGVNELIFSGVTSSQLTVRFPRVYHSITEEEAIYNLTFTTGEPDAENTVTFNTTTSLAELRQYPYQENTAPNSTLPDELEAERLEYFSFVATASDLQNDFLSYKWTHLSAPPGCEYSFNDQGYGNADIFSQCQGAHNLQLSIYDGFNSSLQNITVNVIPLLAEITPIPTAQLIFDDSLDVSLDITNLTEDGPFSYEIAYGPRGLSIDDSGRITGRPKPFIYSGQESFNVAISVDNGRTQTATFTIEMESQPPQRSLLPSAEFCFSESDAWGDVDNNGKVDVLCKIANSYKLFEIENNNWNLTYTELVPPSYTELVTLTQYDVTNDGVNEILLGYEESIYVINGEDKSVLREVDLPASTQSDYYRNYTLYPLPMAFEGILLFVNGGEDSGYYVIEFIGDDNIVTKLPGIGFNAGTANNVDADPYPEFLSLDGLELRQVNGSSDALPLAAQHLLDMDGDGAVDAVSLISTDENNSNSERDFELTIIDTNDLSITLAQTLTIPASYTQIWQPSSHIVNIDNDAAKEIILHYGSIYKLFVFDYDGTEFKLISEVDVPSESNNFQPIVKNLNSNQALVSFNEYNRAIYTYSFGTTLSPLSPTSAIIGTHLHDSYGVSKPTLNDNGLVTFFHESYGDKDSLSYSTLNATGDLLSLIPTGIPAPYSMSGIIEGAFSSPNANEALVSYASGGVGYQLYDIDLDLLITETSFTPQVDWPASFLLADFNNDGRQDVLTYNSGESPLSWIDPLRDELLWNFTLNDRYYPVMARAHIADLNRNELPDIVYGLNHRDLGLELHIREWNGQELLSRFNFSYQRLDKIYYSTTYGLQDVDGDGRQEIILSTTSSNCNEFTLNEFIVLDDDLSVLSEGETSTCIRSIPTFQSEEGKLHLVVSARTSDLTVTRPSSAPAYTHFEEIDINTGNSIWKSSPFFGTLDPRSLVLFGDEHDNRKAAVFSYGIYTFH